MIKSFTKYILTLVVVLMTTTPAWAAWAGSGEAAKYENGTYYVYYDMGDKSKTAGGLIPVYFDAITLNGPGSKVEFEAKRTIAGTGDLVLRVNNGTWKDVWSNGLKTNYNSYSQSIDTNVTQIQFYMPTGSLNKTYKSLKVTMAQYIENPSKTTFEFGSGKVDDTNSVGSFKIPWCNVPAMNVTKAGEGSEYITVSVANNSEPGKYNTATFTITYDRTKASNLNATVTVTNSYGNYSKTITIKGSTSKYDQTLSWNNESAIETNMQLGKTQTVTATATSGLAVTYSSSDDKVLTVDATGKITAVGIGSATITASQAGNYKYNAASSITKTYTVWNKNTPIFTPNGFNEANVCHLKVGDKVTLEVLNVSDGLSGDFKVNTDNNILGVTRSGNTITIEALNAGTTDAIFTQTENNDIFGAEKKYQFSVTKFNNTLAIASTSYTKYVDDEITNIISSVNSDAAVTTSSSDATIAYYDVTSNKILIPNSEAKSFSSKTITITIAQAETYKYAAAEKTITLTVNKYTPTFTWNAANTPYYFGTSIPNIFSTTNPDCQYTIVSDNEHVAKVIDNTLHIYNVEETANITVTQAENYKWNGKTETYTITPANPNNHVTFTYTQAMFNDGTITTQKVAGNSCNWDGNGIKLESDATNWDDKFIVIHFEGIPKDISFKYKASTDNVSNGWTEYRQADWYIAESADGKEWSNYPWENLGGDKSNSTSWVTVSNKPLQFTTRYLKFCYSGNFAGYYSDITVTERREFTAIPDAVDFGVKGLNYGEQDTLITFNHINAGRITKVELRGNDASYFTVNPTVIPNTGRDQYGTTYINITFDNKKDNRGESPYNAELRIYDNNGQEEIVPLTGKRYGKSYPQFKWNPNGLPYYTNSSIVNIATSSNTDYTNCPLTYTTTDPTIAKVENGVLYIYDKEQEVTITVSQDGNNDFYAGSSKLTFTPRKRPDLVVPFHVTYDIYNKAVNPVYFCKWNESEAAIQVGENSGIFEAPAWDWNAKTALITFEGVPGKLSFKYRAINASSTNAIWLVEESADGIEWNEVYRETSSSTNYTNANDIELNENTRYLRFSFSGNFGGYIKDINVSELVGYKYLRAADGHYLSRGAKYGTQAVVDAFGVVSRISRYTQDNENIYTRFFFVDNEQYMFETETADAQRLHEVFTDHGTADNTNHLWQINNNGGILTIQSANDVGVSHRGNYITAINGVLAFTTNEAEATKWQMEDYTEHPQYITDMLNRQAAAAAIKDFGQDVNTLEKVRSRIKEEDFEVYEINIPILDLGEQTGVDRTIEGMPEIYEQIITDVDTGFYRLTVKALYRISNSEIAWKCNQEKGKESVLAYAYANDVQFPIQSVYASYQSPAFENTDEVHNGKYYSTTLSSADIAFNDENRYLNDVYVYVTPDSGKTTGTLHYGIKCPSYVPGAWLAYSTITLTRFARKEYVFQGTDSHNPTDWHTPANWNRNEVPNQYHNVRIQTNATIASHAEVFSLTIDPNVSIHITSTGGLSVGALGIHGAATNGSSIIIDNLKTGAGFLRISPDYHGTMPHFTMRYETASTLDNGANLDATWQYIGAPGADCQFTVDHITWLYHWSEKEGWINKTGTLTLEPFAGYAITQYGKPTYELVSTVINQDKTITLTKTTGDTSMDGDNLFANSYSAPIDAKNFTPEDFSGEIVKTFYLFNSGSWNNWNNNQDSTLGSNNSNTPGQYRAIPALAAEYLNTKYDQTTISPMQGVYMIANTNGATITLNYDKHVWQAGSAAGTNMHEPMRTPSHDVFKPDNFRRLRIQVNSANSGADRMYVIQDTITTTDYDNGYDAPNQLAEGLANIYTNEHFGQMEVSCSNHIDSTFVGFTAGSDSIYTLRFNAIIGDDLHLYDLDNYSLILLEEDATYTFHATPHSKNDLRFQILLHPEKNLDFGEEEKDEIYTGITDVHTTQVWSHGSSIYISNAPTNTIATLYNISGHKLLSTPIHHTPYTLDLSYLPKGVYMLQLNTQVYKFFIQ